MLTQTSSTIWILFAAILVLCTAVGPAMARNDAIASSGDAAPGTSDTFTAFDDPVINDDGKVAFFGITTGERGIWSSGGGTLAVVAQEGVGEAPGVPSSRYRDLHTRRLFLNDAGDVAFEGVLEVGPGGVTFGDDAGIWASESGTLTLKFRSGTAHPDGTPDSLFLKSGWPVSWLRYNNSGDILRILSLPFGESAILSTFDGTELIAETSAGGTLITGADFSGFLNPALSNTGDVAFQATLKGVPQDENSGIWKGKIDGPITPFVQEGDTAPGTGFAEFERFSYPVINDSADVAFQGAVVGCRRCRREQHTGIWASSGGILDLIAREGSGGVPGLPGANFSFGFGGSPNGGPALNNNGDVAFAGGLEVGAGGVTSLDAGGLWVHRSGSGLEQVARVGSGDVPGVSETRFGSFGEIGFNDVGMVTVEGGLQNGSGGVNFANNSGIWVFGPNGDSETIVRKGDTVDGKFVTRVDLVLGASTGVRPAEAMASDGYLTNLAKSSTSWSSCRQKDKASTRTLQIYIGKVAQGARLGFG